MAETMVIGPSSTQVRTFDVTQWSNQNISPIVVPDGTAYGIFDLLTDAQKIQDTGNPANGQINITQSNTPDPGTGAIGNYIKMDWLGTFETLEIRVNIGIDQSATDYMRMQLVRRSDGTVISTIPFSIDSNDVPEKIISVTTISYVASNLDPFVTSGFRLRVANDSGQALSIVDGINVLIARRYRRPLTL